MRANKFLLLGILSLGSGCATGMLPRAATLPYGAAYHPAPISSQPCEFSGNVQTCLLSSLRSGPAIKEIERWKKIMERAHFRYSWTRDPARIEMHFDPMWDRLKF